MKLAFLLPIILSLGGMAYSTWRLVSLVPSTASSVRWIVGGLWVLCFLALILTFAMRDALPTAWARTLYPLSTSWLIYFLYAILILLALDVARLVPQLRSHLAPSWTLLSLVWITLVSLLTYGSIRYRNKERVALELQLTKPLERPIKIVALSDMHLGYTIGKGELREWVKLINQEKPDLVLIAGDIVDGDTRPVLEDKLSEEINQIQAPIYAVLGNHEYIGGEARERHFLGQTKIQLLQDSVALHNNSLYIVGRDDRSNRARRSTAELVQSLDKTKPIILLDHQPYHLEESEVAGVDLQLSGHTHRGQVFPINLIVDRIYEQSHGYLKKGNTHYYISSGMGIWGGKYRIGTQSEYVVITLK